MTSSEPVAAVSSRHRRSRLPPTAAATSPVAAATSACCCCQTLSQRRGALRPRAEATSISGLKFRAAPARRSHRSPPDIARWPRVRPSVSGALHARGSRQAALKRLRAQRMRRTGRTDRWVEPCVFKDRDRADAIDHTRPAGTFRTTSVAIDNSAALSFGFCVRRERTNERTPVWRLFALHKPVFVERRVYACANIDWIDECRRLIIVPSNF